MTSKYKPMKDAPRDGTPILAIYDGGHLNWPVAVMYSGDDDYPWMLTTADNAYPEGRLVAWTEIDWDEDRDWPEEDR